MGRPKSFQPDEALGRAIDVFWEKGYDGASVDDLTKAMGINRFSMYATFGDKRALFLQALRAHEESWAKGGLRALDTIDALDRLQEHFYVTIDAALEERADRCGCVMVLTAVTQASHDSEAATLVREHHAAFVERLERLLERVRRLEGLREGVTPASGAMYLAVLAKGMVVAGASGVERAQLRKTIRLAIEALRP